MEKKEISVINIILTCVILLLSVSILIYLFTLRPWKRESDGVSDLAGEEVTSNDNLAESETLVEGTLTVSDNADLKHQLSTEEQISLFRQFLLRGDLMKGKKLDASQLRYRLYDIDNDGIMELFLVTPPEAGSQFVVFGMLWLDKDNRIVQTLFTCPAGSNAMMGTIWMDGKLLEAEYYDHQYAKWWIIRDVNSYKDSIFKAGVASFGYDCGEYKMSRNDSFQISEDEFPQFYQRVNMIVGTGPMFDSYDKTISYQELIGDETLDPGFAEYGVEFDWGKETDQPYDCALDMRYDGTMYTLPFADNIVIHRFASDADEIGGFYLDNLSSFDELNKRYYDRLTNEDEAFYGETVDGENSHRRLFALGPRNARGYVQIKNGEVIALWIEGP
jgi:hypothetical protein